VASEWVSIQVDSEHKPLYDWIDSLHISFECKKDTYDKLKAEGFLKDGAISLSRAELENLHIKTAAVLAIADDKKKEDDKKGGGGSGGSGMQVVQLYKYGTKDLYSVLCNDFTSLMQQLYVTFPSGCRIFYKSQSTSPKEYVDNDFKLKEYLITVPRPTLYVYEGLQTPPDVKSERSESSRSSSSQKFSSFIVKRDRTCVICKSVGYREAAHIVPQDEKERKKNMILNLLTK